MVSKSLDCPRLYKRAIKYAMALCRGWANREEQAEELVQEGYVRALVSLKSYDEARQTFEKWVLMKVRDAWCRFIETRDRKVRRLFSVMADVRITNDEGDEWEPEVRVEARQEDLVLAKELIRQRTMQQHVKLATEMGLENGEIPLGNLHFRTDRRDVEQWDTSETIRRRELDVLWRRQAARRNIRRAWENRARTGLALT